MRDGVLREGDVCVCFDRFDLESDVVFDATEAKHKRTPIHQLVVWATRHYVAKHRLCESLLRAALRLEYLVIPPAGRLPGIEKITIAHGAMVPVVPYVLGGGHGRA